MITKKYPLVFVFLFIASTVFAQYTDVINSNRPGVSHSAFSVGRNVAQVEAGPYYTTNKHSLLKQDVNGFGLRFMGRYGLLWEQLEINLQTTFQMDKLIDKRSEIGDPVKTKRSNFKNLTLGAKYLVFDPYKDYEEKPNLYSYHANRKFKWRSLLPAVSVFAGVNYDTADNPYTAPDVEGISPKVMLCTQNNFKSGWVMVINAIKDRIGSEYSPFIYVFTLTKAVNEQWVLFGETQGIKSDFYADNLFRVGGAYLWNKNLQLDTTLTFNTKDTPSVFNVNLGASYRLDKHKDPKKDNGTDAKDEEKRRKNKKGKDKDGKKEKKHERQNQDIDFEDE